MRVTAKAPQPQRKKKLEEDDGKPLVPVPEPASEEKHHIVPDHKERTTAEALLFGLRAQGFTLRVEKEKLLVSPVSKLTMIQKDALKEAKAEIKAILEWESIEATVTTETLRAWYQTMENAERKAKERK